MTRTLRDAKILYEINVRPWLSDLGVTSLMEVPDAALDDLSSRGVDLVWLMGVWQSGSRARELALTHPDLQPAYRAALSDFDESDVVGSPYSIASYVAASDVGGPEALAHFRTRLAARQMGLILDFVVNQTGVDHPWVTDRPELYVTGDENDLERAPHDFFRAAGAVIAHARDPYFPAWTDSAQLDLFSPATRDAMCEVLASIAQQCDGVRCDMSMLALRSVFEQIWGARTAGKERTEGEVWPDLIAAAKERRPGFLFIAEVYWGREEELRALGFDYVYDKALYDHLAAGRVNELRRQLSGDRDLVRFLENHDEPRAAAVFPPDRHRAAAVVVATLPGLFLLHEGQLSGRRIRVAIQLRRRPPEPPDQALASFYDRLLHVLRDPLFRRGSWQPVETRSAWEGNPTWENFLAYEWQLHGRRAWIVVNFAPHQGQCFAMFRAGDLRGRRVELREMMGTGSYLREGDDVAAGLYVDLPAFGVHVFEVRHFTS